MKESVYNLCVRDPAGRHGLFNTRSGTLQLIERDAYAAYWAAANGARPIEDAAERLASLAASGFIVENEADELAELEAAHVAARTSREKLALVIAPSMACNLDCSYCFEANRYAGRMSAQTQENLVRLVRRYLDGGTRHVAVTWYGGEPLLGLAALRRLSQAFLGLCDRYGARYSADIVSNGTLLTPERARALAALNISRAQITLDGVPELHDRRRIRRNNKPSFDQVVAGIAAAAEHMHVSVRVNVCREGAARLDDLLRILVERGLRGKISLYLGPLRQPPFALSASTSGEAEKESIAYLSGPEAAQLMLDFEALLRRYGFPTAPNPLPQPRTTTCIADRDHSFMIEPNGDVQKCDWTPGRKDEAVGRLTPEGIAFGPALGKWQDWSAFRRADCRSCVMLPVCLGLCPLRKMAEQPDSCPAFLHNWERALAQACGFRPEESEVARLPLVGPRFAGLALRHLAALAESAPGARQPAR